MRRQPFWLLLGVALAFGAIPLAGQGRGRGGTPVNLPEGPAKESIQTLCSNCHSLNNIVNSGGYTREGWQHAPRHDGRAAGRSARGDRRLSGEELSRAAATAGGHHSRVGKGDVQGMGGADAGLAAARSARGAGRLALVHGQFANVLGRRRSEDRRDQGISARRRRSPARTAWPRTRTATSGSPATSKGYIGKLDPKTGEVTEYKMPARPPAIRTRRSSIRRASSGSRCRAQHGRAARSEDRRHQAGRRRRRRGRNPYGMVVNSKGMPFFVEFGANKIAQHRSGHDGDQRIHAAECRDAAAAHRHHAATTCSGMRTIRAAISAGSIRRPAR